MPAAAGLNAAGERGGVSPFFFFAVSSDCGSATPPLFLFPRAEDGVEGLAGDAGGFRAETAPLLCMTPLVRNGVRGG